MSTNMKRDEAMERVQNNYALLEAYKLEKQGIDAIVDQALNYPASGNRWPAYEALKRQANLIVGWDAASPELTGSQYHEVMVDFIDYLLPQSISEDETSRHDLYIDENALGKWYTRAEQVLATLQEQRALLQSPQTENQQHIEKLVSNLFVVPNDTEEW